MRVKHWQRFWSFRWILGATFVAIVLLGTAWSVAEVYVPFITERLQKLDTGFRTHREFKPTRIFSDSSCVPVGSNLSAVKNHLKAELGNPSPGPNGTSMIYEVTLPERKILPLSENALHVKSAPSHAQLVLEFSNDSKNRLLTISKTKSPLDTNPTLESFQEICIDPSLLGIFKRASDLNEGAPQAEYRSRLTFDEMPSLVWQAILAIEDPRYLEHRGLDPKGILRAALVNLKNLRLSQGGSTITGQLVKNLLNRKDRNIFLKLHELFFSLWLEQKYGKQAILERYLNEVYLGTMGGLEIHGIAEATKLYFKKDPSEITLPEAASLAAMIKGPGVYSPFLHYDRLVERKNLVLDKMLEHGFIAQEEHREARRLNPVFSRDLTARQPAQGFLDVVFNEAKIILGEQYSDQDIMSSGLRIFTTLQPVAQKIALEVAQTSQLDSDLELAIVTISNSTGAVISWVGSKDYAISQFDRVAGMRRQVGSTFKPFVYLNVLGKNKSLSYSHLNYNTATPVFDGPVTIRQGRLPAWRPENYTKNFLGWIPMSKALAQSLNTVSVRLFFEGGLDPLLSLLNELGYEGSLPKVPALALGVSENSPLNVARTYSTLANLGVKRAPPIITSIQNAEGEVIYEAPLDHSTFDATENSDLRDRIYLLEQLLHENTLSGTAKAIGESQLQAPVFGKTGTTSDGRDAWFAGYTPEHTSVVWVGVDHTEDKTIKRTLTGATTSLPLWLRLALNYEKQFGTSRPDSPDSVFYKERLALSERIVPVKVDIKTGRPFVEACANASTATSPYFEGAALLSEWKDQDSCENQEPIKAISEFTF